jgi:hypothetical protein
MLKIPFTYGNGCSDSFFGFIGILLTIPLVAVLYTLVHEL